MDVSAVRLEALKEIVNIGSGNAASSLSSMLRTKIVMTVPRVWLVPLNRLSDALGNLDELRVAMFLKVEGGAQGKAVFVLDQNSAEIIVKKLLGQYAKEDLLHDEMAHSALKEITNIMVSSFVTALSTFSGIPLQISVPALGIDMIGAMMDAVLTEGGRVDDKVLILDTKLSACDANEEYEGVFLFIPEEGALDKLLGVFGI
ncbi:MAG: chemotaxis protein CheC [Peptococcaceae bacterium]|nr:chemotaxis protein CheC [Peptococcaceae bacterium]